MAAYRDTKKINELIKLFDEGTFSVCWRDSGYYPISLYIFMRELYKAWDSENPKKCMKNFRMFL
ncbi:hypothetical protein DAD80_07750 [Bacillus altitudinis]|nr:hypothetical protein [Bacillus aerophilus]PUF90730.1 hypothetical protein DAD80_07750 [Bacillus altitudinis]PWN83736.1 hypothetical protein CTM99_15220 [Bacillus altitudinis]